MSIIKNLIRLSVFLHLTAFIVTIEATTITVDTLVDEVAIVNENCTLREAITAANTDVAVDSCSAGSTGIDIINFSVIGILVLQDALPTIDDSLEIIGPSSNAPKALRIVGNLNNQIAHLTPNFPNNNGMLQFNGASALGNSLLTLKIKNLSLENGSNTHSTLAVGGTGGCLSVEGQSDVTLDHVILTRCYSALDGAAIHFNTQPAFSAISKSKLTILWSQISSSIAESFGGGIYVHSDADVLIKNSIINNNYGFGGGGGLSIKPKSKTGASLEIDKSTFSQNTTSGHIGGALALLQANQIQNYPLSVSIRSGTIFENYVHDGNVPSNPPVFCSGEGAGIAIRDNSISLYLENTIISGNKDRDFDRAACLDSDLYIPLSAGTPTVTSGDTNYLGQVFLGAISVNPWLSSDNIGSSPPLLKALDNYGGSTPTRPPLDAGSVIVDNGACSGDLYDQRGYGDPSTELRPIETCDIGAVEFGAATFSVPAAAIQISPQGLITDNTPTYTWYAVTNAEEYYLSVTEQWYSASSVGCSSYTGTCSLTPSVTLPVGAGSWKLIARNAQGEGSANEKNFNLITAPPTQATLIGPVGATTDITPTYTWNAVSESSDYYLWVDDSNGNKIKQWYTANEAGCASGTGICSVTPTTALANGAGTWWVQTKNVLGYGPWSAASNMTVISTPPAATLTSPNGTITDSTPTYIWNAVSNSSWYYLWVNDSSGNKIKKWYTADQVGCTSGTGSCSITPTTLLASGAVSWWIQTWNAVGYGPWSSGMQVSIVPPTLPPVAQLISPVGLLFDTTPTYSWHAVSNSSWYYLWVDDSSGNKIKQWYTAAQVGCATGTGACSVTPTTVLASDESYNWKVQTWNAVGYGPWSNFTPFTILP